MVNEWQEVSVKEAEAFSQGKFQGMMIEQVQGLRRDVQELQQQNAIKSYISFAIAGVAGLIGSFVYQISSAIGKH